MAQRSDGSHLSLPIRVPYLVHHLNASWYHSVDSEPTPGQEGAKENQMCIARDGCGTRKPQLNASVWGHGRSSQGAYDIGEGADDDDGQQEEEHHDSNEDLSTELPVEMAFLATTMAPSVLLKPLRRPTFFVFDPG